MSKTTTITTEIDRRVNVILYRNGAGHITLSDPTHGDFVQAALSKDEIDKLRDALTGDKDAPEFGEGQRLVVTGTEGHGLNVGDIVTVENFDSDGVYRVRRICDGYGQYILAKDLTKVSGITPKYPEGATVVVTGDSNTDYLHKYPVGATVRIVEHRDEDGDYWVEDEDTGYEAYVHEGDMKAAPKFTEGDRVRVIGNTRIMHHFEIGDIVTVCEDSYGDVIECMKTRPNGRPLYQGVSVEDLEPITGPELVEGDIYLDEDFDTWTVRYGVLALRDGRSREFWEDVEESYGPLKKISGWHVVLPNGEKVKELITDSPELFKTQASADFRAKVRTEALKNVGASDTTCKVVPVFV